MINLARMFEEVFPKSLPVVFLHAHPDDEAFLSAGLINELLRKGRTCAVVYGAAALLANQPKTKIRQNEAKAAAGIIGLKTLVFLEFCEPQYSAAAALPLVRQDVSRVCQALTSALEQVGICNQCILISYDQNGGYGNCDHKMIHSIGRSLRAVFPQFVSTLYEVTLNRDRIVDWLSSAKVRLSAESLPKLAYWSQNFGLRSSEISHYFELNSEQLKLKRNMLAAHASQMCDREFPLCLSAADFAEVFGKEWLLSVQT